MKIWLMLVAAVALKDINDRHKATLETEFRHISVEQQRQLYSEYVRDFSRPFSAERFFVFQQNLKTIVEHNAAGRSWKMGINEFADETFEEFKSKLLMSLPQNCSATQGNYGFTGASVPDSFDWREKGMVSPVKNQAHCGSCWTFSTTGCLESHALIHLNQKFNLSEQQFLDCAGDFDNHGCNGGLPSHAFTYLYYRNGLQEETTYPYQAANGTCAFDKHNAVLNVEGGVVNITALDENALIEAIATQGPVSVAFQVVNDFRFYKSGVYQSTDCKNGADDVNHAVLAVGYGIEDGKLHYIVKNSWSATWGDNGFFKILRNVNMCGIAQCNSYPILKKADGSPLF